MTTMFGISNCDTIRRARAWLDAHGVDYRFHDYKKDGIEHAIVAGWVERTGWEPLVNRSGTTFRKLPEADKAGLDDTRAIALMLAYPSAIRRPVIEHRRALLIGFDADRYAAAFEEAGG